MFKISSFNTLFNPQNISLISASSARKKDAGEIFLHMKKNALGINTHFLDCTESTELENLLQDIKCSQDVIILFAEQKNLYTCLEYIAEKRAKVCVIASCSGILEEDFERIQKHIRQFMNTFSLPVFGIENASFINTHNGLYCVPYSSCYPYSPSLPIDISFPKELTQSKESKGSSKQKENRYYKGNMSFFTHCEKLFQTFFSYAVDKKIPLAKCLHMSEKSAITKAETLEFFAQDAESHLIITYIDSIEKNLSFLQSMQTVSPKKPVLVLLANNAYEQYAHEIYSQHQTHSQYEIQSTPEISPKNLYAKAYEALFLQNGILIADNIPSLFSLAKALLMPQTKLTKNVVLIGNNDTATKYIADNCVNTCGVNNCADDSTNKHTYQNNSNQLQMPKSSFLTNIQADVQKENYIYLHADSSPLLFPKYIESLLKENIFDALFIVLAPLSSKNYMLSQVEEFLILSQIANLYHNEQAMLFICLTEDTKITYQNFFHEKMIPTFSPQDNLAEIFSRTVDYNKWKKNFTPVDIRLRCDSMRAKQIIKEALSLNSSHLHTKQLTQLAVAYELPLTETLLARNSEQAARYAKKLSYPVILRLNSPSFEIQRFSNDSQIFSPPAQTLSSEAQIAFDKTQILSNEMQNISGETQILPSIAQIQTHTISRALHTASEVKEAFYALTTFAIRACPDDYIAGCTVQHIDFEGMQYTIKMEKNSQLGAIIALNSSNKNETLACRLAPLSYYDANYLVEEVLKIPRQDIQDRQNEKTKSQLIHLLLTVSQMVADIEDISELVLDISLYNQKIHIDIFSVKLDI